MPTFGGVPTTIGLPVVRAFVTPEPPGQLSTEYVPYTRPLAVLAVAVAVIVPRPLVAAWADDRVPPPARPAQEPELAAPAPASSHQATSAGDYVPPAPRPPVVASPAIPIRAPRIFVAADDYTPPPPPREAVMTLASVPWISARVPPASEPRGDYVPTGSSRDAPSAPAFLPWRPLNVPIAPPAPPPPPATAGLHRATLRPVGVQAVELEQVGFTHGRRRGRRR